MKPERTSSTPYLFKSGIWLLLLVAVAGFGGIGPSDHRALLLLAICFLGGLADTGLGMGYGTLIAPVLLMLGYVPGEVVPAVLLSQVASGFTGAFFHNEIRNVDFTLGGSDLTRAAILATGSVVGVAVGYWVALNLPRTPLTVAIGLVIAVSGIVVLALRRRRFAYRHWKMWLLATTASFNKTVSGGGYGPLVTSGQILSGVSGRAAVAITALAEGATSTVAAALLLWSIGMPEVELLLPIMIGALAAVPFSAFAVRLISEDKLKLAIGVLTTVIGLVLVWDTLG